MSIWPTTIVDTYAVFQLYSSPATFAISITAPVEASTVTASSFQVQWTYASTQISFRVRIYNNAEGTGTPDYDSGIISSATKSHTVPSGSVVSGSTYYIKVTATDTTLAAGVSDLLSFVASWGTSVDITGLTVVADDAGPPPFIQLDWDEVSEGAGETFLRYTVFRRKSGETSWERISIDTTTKSTTQYNDYTASAGITYEYTVTWEASTVGGVLESAQDATPPSDNLTFPDIWLHLLGDVTKYVELESNSASVSRVQEISYSRARGRANPSVFIGDSLNSTISLKIIPINLTTRGLYTTLADFQDQQKANGAIVVVRPGYSSETYFATLTSIPRTDTPESWTMDISLTELHHDESV